MTDLVAGLAFAITLLLVLAEAFRFGAELSFLILAFALTGALACFFEAFFNALATSRFFGAVFLTGFAALADFSGRALSSFFAFTLPALPILPFPTDGETLVADLDADFDFDATEMTLDLGLNFVLALLESDSLI